MSEFESQFRYHEDWCKGSTTDFDSVGISSNLVSSAISKSNADGTANKTLKRPGGRIRSVHPLKSAAMRTVSLWRSSILVAVYGLPQRKPFYMGQ